MAETPSHDSPTPRIDSRVVRAVQSPLGLFALLALLASQIASIFTWRSTGSDAWLGVMFVSGVFLALITVVAVIALRNPDALREGNLREQHSQISTGSALRTRREHPQLEHVGREAMDLLVVGISLVSVIAPFSHYFEGRIRRGCRLRVILLNPTTPELSGFESSSRFQHAAGDIGMTLNRLREMTEHVKRSGGSVDRVEVRLSNALFPFSMVGIDPESDNGLLIVEFHTFRTTLGERPHVQLRRTSDTHWFNFYLAQFDALWQHAEPWTAFQQQSDAS